YQASDGQAKSGTATATITVTAINHAPVARNDSAGSTLENTALTVTAANGVLTNDTDADGNPLTAVPVGDAAHGHVTLNPNGSFTYTPNASFVGSDSFTYKANDGQALSNAAIVTINVKSSTGGGTADQAPVANSDGPFGATEDTLLAINSPGVLANDTDA